MGRLSSNYHERNTEFIHRRTKLDYEMINLIRSESQTLSMLGVLWMGIESDTKIK